MEEVELEEKDIYSGDVEAFLDNDEISAFELGFMIGYNDQSQYEEGDL